MASLPLPMKGSCFCNEIQYTLNATPIYTNCCHCRNCQSLSGSAFAINCMVETSAVNVTSDTKPMEKIQQSADKTVPGAKSYHCPNCATMVWATVGFFGDGLVFVRAGTLEASEQIVPDGHFFVRSKHPWVQIPDNVPSFETMPGKEDGPLWKGKARERFDAATQRA